eukprot:TRINITY_DN3060_c0_g1_i1.p1 TRINITY_DN3060_c0_g1~~TRINITY_DN3060_c0_g1_i1.p1  ORF type:complete len:290 (+),score=72.29 TRINITY_DN3060_c0_g1_i1:1789-2658(+)
MVARCFCCILNEQQRQLAAITQVPLDGAFIERHVQLVKELFGMAEGHALWPTIARLATEKYHFTITLPCLAAFSFRNLSSTVTARALGKWRLLCRVRKLTGLKLRRATLALLSDCTEQAFDDLVGKLSSADVICVKECVKDMNVVHSSEGVLFSLMAPKSADPEGMWRRAIKKYEHVLAINPANCFVRCRAADAYLQLAALHAEAPTKACRRTTQAHGPPRLLDAGVYRAYTHLAEAAACGNAEAACQYALFVRDDLGDAAEAARTLADAAQRTPGNAAVRGLLRELVE